MRIQSIAAATVLMLAAREALAMDITDFEKDQLPTNAVWMDTLNVRVIDQATGRPRAKTNVDRKPMVIHGITYPRGVGTAAPGEIRIKLNGQVDRFVAAVGIDDATPDGAARLVFTLDGAKDPAYTSTGLTGGGGVEFVSVPTAGAKEMVIDIQGSNEGATAKSYIDLGGAMFLMKQGATGQPEIVPGPDEPPITLPRTEDGRIHINGARVIGATPGHPFLYKIAATGTPEMKYSAEGLPEGLSLDAATGVITGSLKAPSVSVATLKVEQAGIIKDLAASASRKLVIVGGEHKLALTPPMGWNSWNVFARTVTQQNVKDSADMFISTGLASHGYTYINIDDCWEGARDDKGMIQTNEKFPDMKGLGEYIHSKGLKFGIYSSPGPKTCAGFEASYQHEDLDAQQWANWGVDYVKYDLCSYRTIMTQQKLDQNNLDVQKHPYQVMRASLDKVNRDIVYSLCQYGIANVWEWGAADEQVGANLWRTTGDITDTWTSLSDIWQKQKGHEKFAGPGHWNDPDMLIVGKVGWGKLHETALTQNEQMIHITSWSIMASPLLIGCDLTQIGDFTKSVLMNDEVLAVNQDPLGKQGYVVSQVGTTQVWKRELWDGTIAVGLYNLGRTPAKVTAKWSDLGISGSQSVRDLWQLKDLAPATDSFTTEVPRHGVVLLKIGTPANEDDSIAKVVAMYTK